MVVSMLISLPTLADWLASGGAERLGNKGKNMRALTESWILKIERLQPIHISLASVVATSLVVPFFSILFHGTVTYDYLLTGAITSLLVSYVFLSVIHLYQKKLRAEVEMRKQTEAALWEELRLSELKDNQLGEHDRLKSIRLEKLKTISQLMHKVNHHVGNLSHKLQLLEYVQDANGAIPQNVLDALKQAVRDTCKEMRELSNIDDPFNESVFEIRYSVSCQDPVKNADE